MTDLHRLLKQYFGYDSFRPLQEDIIRSVLEGKDTLALLPTGGGKSVCYQIPAMAQPGICLVVTPLIALMKDQVRQLNKRGISALSIYSGLPFYEVKKALQNATSDAFKFLYVSPERLQTRLFKEYLPAMNINLIAVDEAHCISQWGYDFRPPYLEIANIREELPGIPVLALTASATKDVQADICEKLRFSEQNIYRQSFEKPNLSFSAFNLPHKLNKLYDILTNVPGSALVYVRNRRKTKEIAKWLQMKGIDTSYYNAGLSNEERSNRQDDWLTNKVRVMVCTNAFGMGIDKPDVRTVVHLDVPDCIESYYQEAGRAGRDDKRSYAVLLYNDEELSDLEQSTAKKFPSLDIIRSMYEAICNYLQVPVGSGEGEYFDFNLPECCERFKLDAGILINALQTLAQAGYISFSENVFIPSKAGFVVRKEILYAFEKDNPALESIIKSLLRTYEGIFDNEVNIQEKTIARLLQTEEADVAKKLLTLDRYHIINYQRKKDTPQLYFIYDRVSASHIVIDTNLYEKRKQQYKSKINEMIRYATNTRLCRSNIIRAYFGDTDIRDCGICDVCLQKSKTPLSNKSVEQLATQLLTLLPQYNSFQQLQQQLRQPLSHVEAAIQYLISEEKIEWDGEGKFITK